MSTMRRLARTVARNKSYLESHTKDMFGYYFKILWRDKGHPESRRLRPTKKKYR